MHPLSNWYIFALLLCLQAYQTESISFFSNFFDAYKISTIEQETKEILIVNNGSIDPLSILPRIHLKVSFTRPNIGNVINHLKAQFKQKLEERKIKMEEQLQKQKDRLKEDYFDCSMPNGMRISHGQKIFSNCEQIKCENGDFTHDFKGKFTPICPLDFEIVPELGCVKFFEERLTWCQARRRCFDIGADLVSIDSSVDLESAEPFYNYLNGVKPRSAWVGLTRLFNSKTFEWNIGNGKANAWSPIWGLMSESDHFKCALSDHQYKYKLSSRSCDNPKAGRFPYICEVPGYF